MKRKYCILIILAFLVSEIVLYFYELGGFLCYILLTGAILISLEKDKYFADSDKLLIFLTIIPIARISEFFIDFGFFWKTLIFYLTLGFLIIFYDRKFKVKIKYSAKNLKLIAISIVLGILLGYGGDYLFNFEKHVEIIALLPLIALSEEILFRGMIQNYTKKDFGPFFSIFATAVLIGTFSLGFGLKFACFMFVSNLLISSMYNKTENIWLTILMNLSMNFFLFVMDVKSFIFGNVTLFSSIIR